MGVWYATRGQVKSALESANGPRVNAQIDRLIEAASRSIEGLLHRRFFPLREVRRFDWPNRSSSPAWSLWLDSNELIEVVELTSGGTVVASGDYVLRRDDDRTDPPFTTVDIKLSSGAAYSSGPTFQQAIGIDGVWGYNRTDTGAPAASLDSAQLNATSNVITMRPVDGVFNVDVGSLLLIDQEYVQVNEMFGVDVTTLTAPLASSKGATVASVADGTKVVVGETIKFGGERLRIEDIQGNDLVVDRAVDGSVLSAHNSGVSVWAPRMAHVPVRGDLGTLASTHAPLTEVYAHRYPGLVNALCVAEAISSQEQASSAYARTVGSGPNIRESVGRGLEDLRAQAYAELGRKLRSGAV